jgi:hypothetical protein
MFMGVISIGFFIGVTLGIPIRGIGLIAAKRAGATDTLYPNNDD